MPKVQVGSECVQVQAKPKRWRFTAEQYQRMGEAGLFQREDRVELLDGEIYVRAPIGGWHNAAVDVANEALTPALRGRAIVRVQGSFRLSSRSEPEPEPDILILRYRIDRYRDELPGPQYVLLLVEVSDTSIVYDHARKLPLYASGPIAELWIVNRIDDRVEVYRQPRGRDYEQIAMRQRGESVSPLAFPDISIPVQELLA
jgi:Uma2 family endonuclease